MYTLYGPSCPYVGALAAGHLVSPNARTLRKTTRRKHFLIYEFDSNCKILRIKHIRDYDKIDCTTHFFELDGITYGRAFLKDEKRFYTNYAFAVKQKNGRPDYFAITTSKFLCVDIYEYPCNNRVSTTCYQYYPQSEFTTAGVRADWDVPMGAKNSPVTVSVYDQPYTHIDFLKGV
jgi:hypothetical protein